MFLLWVHQGGSQSEPLQDRVIEEVFEDVLSQKVEAQHKDSCVFLLFLSCLGNTLVWSVTAVTVNWRLTEQVRTGSAVDMVLVQHQTVCLCSTKLRTRSSRFLGATFWSRMEAEPGQTDRRCDWQQREPQPGDVHTVVGTSPWRMKCNSGKEPVSVPSVWVWVPARPTNDALA